MTTRQENERIRDLALEKIDASMRKNKRWLVSLHRDLLHGRDKNKYRLATMASRYRNRLKKKRDYLLNGPRCQVCLAPISRYTTTQSTFCKTHSPALLSQKVRLPRSGKVKLTFPGCKTAWGLSQKEYNEQLYRAIGQRTSPTKPSIHPDWFGLSPEQYRVQIAAMI